ncbi:MAG: DUF2156 domain-containing protein [Desulfomonile tiedjei]|nr:DUF2156 domain-containing protein [Desulfomonile tiedjei]
MDDFKPVEIQHKRIFDEFFSQDPPQISELTFTNLFMWRIRYRPIWKVWRDCLLIVMQEKDQEPFALPPVGAGDKGAALAELAVALGSISPSPHICRVPENFLEPFVDTDRYRVREDRANSDYVYLAEELIQLPGNRFHKKKNHINRFVKSYEFEYLPFDADLVKSVLEMQEDWCELRDCGDFPDLIAEDRAIYEALIHFGDLRFSGGVILIGSKVEAFTLGELLNPDMAVIHIEKANPEIPGLYAAINQRFCMAQWSKVKYINREQDLGVPGLRQAKLSYHPDHLVKKFTLTPKK